MRSFSFSSQCLKYIIVFWLLTGTILSANADVLGLPRENEQCGPLSVLMLLRYYKVQIKASDIMRVMAPQRSQKGTSLLQCHRTLNQNGLYSVGLADVSLKKLLTTLDGTVTALMLLDGKPNQHFVLFLAHHAEQVYIVDAPKFSGWVGKKHSLMKSFADKFGRGSCLLVSDNFSAINSTLEQLKIVPPLTLSQVPKMLLEKRKHVFSLADVKREKGDGVLRVEFPFTNTGEGLLVIKGVRASCGCFRIKDGLLRIQPSETAKLEADIECTEWGKGYQEKFIHVFTNVPGQEIVKLVVAGTCIPTDRDRDPKAEDSSSVFWHPKQLFVGHAEHTAGRNSTNREIWILGPSGVRDLEVELEKCTILGAKVTIRKDKTHDASRRAWVALVKLPDLQRESGERQIVFKVRGSIARSIEVPVQIQKSPRIIVSPSRLAMFSRSKTGAFLAKAELFSPLEDPLLIQSVEGYTDGGEVSVILRKTATGYVMLVSVQATVPQAVLQGKIALSFAKPSQTLIIPFKCYAPPVAEAF